MASGEGGTRGGNGGENGGGSYHSIYDSYDHYVRFDDGEFVYGIALAQTGGRLMLRLADADVLPFEFTDLSETVGKFTKEVTKLADDMRDEAQDLDKLLRDSIYQAVADPKETEVPPKKKSAVPYLNFAPLLNAVSNLKDAGNDYDSARKYFTDSSKVLSADDAKHIDEVLNGTERAFHNDKIDLAQAEAVADLIDAGSREAARAAMPGQPKRGARFEERCRGSFKPARILVAAQAGCTSGAAGRRPSLKADGAARPLARRRGLPRRSGLRPARSLASGRFGRRVRSSLRPVRD